MRFNTILKNQNTKPKASNVALKATSLLYLREALYRERYEECPALIESARKYGARPSEVRQVLAQHIRGIQKGLQNEAALRVGGRKRF